MNNIMKIILIAAALLGGLLFITAANASLNLKMSTTCEKCSEMVPILKPLKRCSDGPCINDIPMKKEITTNG
jgi:hypothetical protein